jgi:hypothetical protein
MKINALLPDYKGSRLMPDGRLPDFLNMNLVCRLIGERMHPGKATHRMTIHRWIKEGRLPVPHRVGVGPKAHRFWRRDDILTVLAAWEA